MRKENRKEEEHNVVPRDSPGGVSCLISPHYNSPVLLQCVKTLNNSTHRHRKQMEMLAAPHSAASATTGNSENRSVSIGSQFV
jgi:hypothetical protein